MLSIKLILLIVPFCAAVTPEETAVELPEDINQYTAAVIRNISKPIPNPIYVQPLLYDPPVEVTTENTEDISSTPKYLPLVEDPLEPLHDYYHCEQDGYYALENRCSLYIHCQNHRALEYSCPLGQHFDRKVRYPHFPCSSPAEALCAYNENRPTEHPLPSVTPTLPPVIPTIPPVIPTHPPVIPTHPPVISTAKPPVVIPTEDISSTPKYLPLVEDPLEPLDDYYHCEQDGYYALENRCSLYIHCQNHRALEYSCPLGQHFDRKVRYPHFPCSSPAEALCAYNENRPTEHPLPSVTPTLPPVIPTIPPVIPTHPSVIPLHPPVISTAKPPVVIPAPKPYHRPETPTKDISSTPKYLPLVEDPLEPLHDYYHCEQDGYYALENRCSMYIHCQNHRALEYACPLGQHFDRKVRYPHFPCSSPAEALCAYNEYRPTEHAVTPTLPPVIPTHPPVIPTAKPPVVIPVPKLNPEGRCEKAYGYFPIQGQCDTYVQCKNHLYLEYYCPDGLHFNPNTQYPEYPCSYPSEVPCVGKSMQPAYSTAECPRLYGLFATGDGDCSRYISCQEGLATYMNCPPGLVFNQKTSTCDYVENVPSCNPEVFRNVRCPEPRIDEYGNTYEEILNIRYGKSCRYYVGCRLGHPRLLTCDEGFAFDESLGRCVDSEYVRDCTN